MVYSSALSGGGKTHQVMVWLKQAVAPGYKDAAQLKAAPVLDALHGREDFQKPVAELEAGPTEKEPRP
jgi:hypothetical protein